MNTQHFDVETYLVEKAKMINRLTDNMKRDCLDLGRHLHDVKETLPHGEWGPWIEAYCPFSHRTANNMINYYLACLGHPEFMHFKKSVIYLLSSKNYPKKLKEQVSQAMQGSHDDLNLKNAFALRTAYINGSITLDSENIKHYLTQCRQASQVDRLKAEGERMDKLLQDQIKNLDKLIAVKIDIDGDLHVGTGYRKKLQEILKDASHQIFQLNDEFKPIKAKLRKYFRYVRNYPTVDNLWPDGNSGLAECHRLFYEGAAPQPIGAVKPDRRRAFKYKPSCATKLPLKHLENAGACYA